MTHTKQHPGFAAVANKIAKKEGVSKAGAAAILASAARKASAAAVKKNAHLKRVLRQTTAKRGY